MNKLINMYCLYRFLFDANFIAVIFNRIECIPIHFLHNKYGNCITKVWIYLPLIIPNLKTKKSRTVQGNKINDKICKIYNNKTDTRKSFCLRHRRSYAESILSSKHEITLSMSVSFSMNVMSVIRNFKKQEITYRM